MTEPKPCWDDLDEPEMSGSGFLISGGDAPGGLQRVDAAFDEGAESVDKAVDRLRRVPCLSGRDDGRAATGLAILADRMRRLAQICRNLAGRDFRLHG